MKNGQSIDLGLTGYDELFMTDQERQENRLPKVRNISLEEIDEFPGHPFQVRMDEDMQELTESIRERGVITPIILRQKEDGRYEIVSGHRRVKACMLAGFETVPAEVREMSRDEAIILMVESNLQRTTILPSEKAFSYKMRLEALKRQGNRSDITSDPLGPKLGSRSNIDVAEQVNESATQVKRYIRLTELIPELLQLVDDRKIALRPAVEISYLSTESQKSLMEAIGFNDATPSHAQAIRLRKFEEDGRLSMDVIEAIMSEEKPNQKEHINIRYEDARKYIPQSVPYNKTGEFIFKALEFYQRHLERQRNDAR